MVGRSGKRGARRCRRGRPCGRWWLTTKGRWEAVGPPLTVLSVVECPILPFPRFKVPSNKGSKACRSDATLPWEGCLQFPRNSLSPHPDLLKTPLNSQKQSLMSPFDFRSVYRAQTLTRTSTPHSSVRATRNCFDALHPVGRLHVQYF